MLDISNTYYTYIDFGDGSQGYGNNIIHQYKENGTYVVKVYYNQQSCTNDDVCTDFFVVALEETVKITELLGVDFEYKVENNGLVKFQSFSKNANVKTLSWDFGDGSNTSSGEYIEHTYASNGKYKVILSGSNTTTKKSALKEIVVIK
jgi:PKD repeat protein